MAIFRRYAAMFRVGTSFIFSSIKSRSASVTLNLICTVLLRPSMCSLLSFPFRGFGTLPNKQFSTDAPQRGRGKIRKWVPASYACYEYFYPLCPYALLRSYARFCQTYAKEKRCNPQKRLQRSLYPVHLGRTPLICPLFRLPLSPLPLRSQSVCPYRSYRQGARQAAAAACSFPAAFPKGTGLRIYCSGA